MEWTLLKSRECDGWHGAICATGYTDDVLADALKASAEVCEDGTLLRAVGADGTTRALRVVVSGKALGIRLANDVRYYLGEEACAAWARDPGRWWVDTSEAHHLLRVAGSAVVPSDQGTQLHHAVVRAACDCARKVLPLWDLKYPSEDLPSRAIVAAEQWCAGTTSIRDLRSVSREAVYVGWDARRGYWPRLVAQAASSAVAAATLLSEAAWGVSTVMQIAGNAGFVSTTDIAGYVRQRVALTPVLVALALASDE